jgi:hypothetical protein
MTNFAAVDHHSLSPQSFASGNMQAAVSYVQEQLLRGIAAKHGRDADAKLQEFNREHRGQESRS